MNSIMENQTLNADQIDGLHELLTGRFDINIGTNHHFSQGLYAKEMMIPANYIVGGHAHNYDHLSILAKGHVIVVADGERVEYKAPACINIKASVHHMIEALTDSVWFCIHATDEKDITKIDEVLIEEKSCQ